MWFIFSSLIRGIIIYMDNFISKIESRLVDFTLAQKPLKTALDRLILTNAKRIRPRLAWLVIKSFGEDFNAAQEELIAAGEILHTASLIHDDIVDNSSERRGLQTLNTMYDSRLAVLAGDFLASYGMKKIIALNNIEIINIFQYAFELMCRAEILQYFTNNRCLDLEEYLKKSSGKTASLFGAILKGVAILSKNIDKNAVYELGLSYGIAFQIKNDLDAFINTPERDKRNGIYTAPSIYCFNGYNLDSAIEKTNGLIDNEIEKMLKLISDFPDETYKNRLTKMIEESLCRTITNR